MKLRAIYGSESNPTPESRFEAGSAVIEFLSLTLLLILPLFSYFTLLTVKSNSLHREEELFREMAHIVRSETNLATGTYLAERYIAFREAGGYLSVVCKSGECPGRGSITEIVWYQHDKSLSALITGGNWQ